MPPKAKKSKLNEDLFLKELDELRSKYQQQTEDEDKENLDESIQWDPNATFTGHKPALMIKLEPEEDVSKEDKSKVDREKRIRAEKEKRQAEQAAKVLQKPKHEGTSPAAKAEDLKKVRNWIYFSFVNFENKLYFYDFYAGSFIFQVVKTPSVDEADASFNKSLDLVESLHSFEKKMESNYDKLKKDIMSMVEHRIDILEKRLTTSQEKTNEMEKKFYVQRDDLTELKNTVAKHSLIFSGKHLPIKAEPSKLRNAMMDVIYDAYKITVLPEEVVQVKIFVTELTKLFLSCINFLILLSYFQCYFYTPHQVLMEFSQCSIDSSYGKLLYGEKKKELMLYQHTSKEFFRMINELRGFMEKGLIHNYYLDPNTGKLKIYVKEKAASIWIGNQTEFLQFKVKNKLNVVITSASKKA